MPFINVQTNLDLQKDKMEKLKAAFGRDITAIPGKSEGWLMVEIEAGKSMWFKGSDAPCAMADVSVCGNAGRAELDNLTGKICDTLSSETGISPDRIYVKYSLVPNWGWNGSNF